jgi:hypothetical protein
MDVDVFGILEENDNPHGDESPVLFLRSPLEWTIEYVDAF